MDNDSLRPVIPDQPASWSRPPGALPPLCGASPGRRPKLAQTRPCLVARLDRSARIGIVTQTISVKGSGLAMTTSPGRTYLAEATRTGRSLPLHVLGAGADPAAERGVSCPG